MSLFRILVELLKERHESRTLVERESRRQRYLNLVRLAVNQQLLSLHCL